MSNHKERRKEKLKERQTLVDVSSSNEGQSKFIKALGSNDYITREKGLETLTLFLSHKKQLELSDMLKLWKGLFFCFWHSDKEAVQDDLAERLARIQLQLPQPMARLYFESFYATMRREWPLIDALRMDKFLRFVRKFVRCTFETLQAKRWDRELVSTYNRYLATHVLLKRDDAVPCLGLYYHLCDVYMQELLGVLRAKKEALPGSMVEVMLGPFVQVLQSGAEAPYVRRIEEGVLDTLVEECFNKEGWKPFKGLNLQALHGALFSLAASESTTQRARETLYRLCERLEVTLRKHKAFNDDDVPMPEPEAAEPEPAAPTPAPASGKKDKSAKKRAREEEVEEPAAPEPTPAPSASKKSKKDKAPETPAPAPVAEPTPKPSSKKKDRAVKPVEEEEKEEEVTPVPQSKSEKKRARVQAEELPTELKPQGRREEALRGTGKASTASAAAAAPVSASKVQQNKSKKQTAAPGMSTPLGAGAVQEAGYDSDQTGMKKRVRFALKNNLVLDPRRPPPPADVRTPPSAQPRGSALKKTSNLYSPVSGGLRSKLKAAQTHTPSPLGRGAAPASKAGLDLNRGLRSDPRATTPTLLPSGKAGASAQKPGSGKKGGMSTPSVVGGVSKVQGSLKKTPGSAGRPKAADFFDSAELPGSIGY